MDNKRKLPPKVSLILRIVGGIYLVYLSWGLLEGAAENPLYGIAVAVFAVIGIALAVYSGTALYKGQFEGGKADPNWDSEPASEDEDYLDEEPDEEPEE